MTVANGIIPLAEQQHLVLDYVSWDFYERVLQEVGNRPIRVTFDEGSIEIMPPLPEHEDPKKIIARLVEMMTFELDIPTRPFGSSTFRREDRQKGLEPDECYYLANEARVRGMKQFDPSVYPPPDLAVEVDITSRSIPRQPIYEALGVPELWRFDGVRIHVLRLDTNGRYLEQESSPTFPFLPMREFERFIKRMEVGDQNAVLREFRDWVKSLPR